MSKTARCCSDFEREMCRDTDKMVFWKFNFENTEKA